MSLYASKFLRDTFSSVQRLPYTVRVGSKLNLFIKFNAWESFFKSFRDNPRSTKIPKPCLKPKNPVLR